MVFFSVRNFFKVEFTAISTTRQDEGIITLESIPTKGTEIQTKQGKGNRFVKNTHKVISELVSYDLDL